MTPDQESRFDPSGLLAALRAAGVEFVLIGGMAGIALGSTILTRDLDVCHRRTPENLDRLAEALRGVEARLRGAPAGVPFLLDGRTLEAGGNFTFATALGSLDIIAFPTGVDGYDALIAAAVTVTIGGESVNVASLDDLIAMKEAAGRPKDRAMALEYRALRDEIRSRADESQPAG